MNNVRIPPFFAWIALGSLPFILSMVGLAVFNTWKIWPFDGGGAKDDPIPPTVDLRVCSPDCTSASPMLTLSSVVASTPGNRGGDPVNLLFYSPYGDQSFEWALASELTDHGWELNDCGLGDSGPSAFARSPRSQIIGTGRIHPFPGTAMASGMILRLDHDPRSGCNAQFHVRLYKVDANWTIGAAHQEAILCGVNPFCGGSNCTGFHCVTSWESAEQQVADVFAAWPQCRVQVAGVGYPPALIRNEVPAPEPADNSITVIGVSCSQPLSIEAVASSGALGAAP